MAYAQKTEVTSERQVCDVRMWAVDLVLRHSTELALGSVCMTLNIADTLARYVLTGDIPTEVLLDEDEEL